MKTHSRRFMAFIRVGLALTLVLAFIVPARAVATPAGDLVGKLNGAFLQVMKNAASLGYDGRYKELEPVVADSFDFTLMSRVAMGSRWQNLTDAQKQTLVDTFRRYSTATYASRLDGFSNQRFEILGEEAKAQDTVLVKNQIAGDSGDPIRIDYLLRPDQGQLKIIDIYLNGSISQLSVYRSEFIDVMGAKGFDGLIATLDQRITEMSKGQPAAQP
ncbi:ABC transporter substrate-binding protein [Hypericibacter sp.]|uniref:ABC transporter substrate-binding protein n=1 Tax=Hypericibacter sp. TaxID=2705401 RepID=UPI003D6D33F1